MMKEIPGVECMKVSAETKHTALTWHGQLATWFHSVHHKHSVSAIYAITI